MPAGSSSTLWHRVGNPHIISVPTLLVSTVFFTLEAYVNVLDGTFTFGTAIIYVFITQGITFGILFLARLVYLRRPFSRGHPVILLSTLVLASFIGVVVGQVVALASQPPSSEPAVISLDSFISRVLVILVVGLVWSALAEYRSASAALIATQEQLEQTRAAGTEALALERSSVTTAIQSLVSTTVRDLELEDPKQARQVFAALADDVVRPMSHELATHAPKFDAVPQQAMLGRSWRSILTEITNLPLISPFWIALIVTIISIRFTLSEVPERLAAPDSGQLAVIVDPTSLGQSMLWLLTTFVTAWIVASLVNGVLRRRLPSASLGRRLVAIGLGFIGIVLALELVSLGLRAALDREVSERSALATFIAVGIVLGIALVIGLVRAVNDRWRQTLDKLERGNADLRWEVTRIQDTLWQERRMLARALHGPLQSTIRAGARQLGSVPPHDLEHFEAVKREVAGQIESALAGMMSSDGSPLDVESHLDGVRRTWLGLCDIRIEMSSDSIARLMHDRVCAAAVIDIVTDAVANAAMHAHAQVVDVQINVEQDRYLVIQAINDGDAVDSPTEPGLGSAILDEVCISWDLTLEEAGGAKLIATLPIQR